MSLSRSVFLNGSPSHHLTYQIKSDPFSVACRPCLMSGYLSDFNSFHCQLQVMTYWITSQMYHGILQLCAFVHAFLFLDYSISLPQSTSEDFTPWNFNFSVLILFRDTQLGNSSSWFPCTLFSLLHGSYHYLILL